MVLVGVSGGVIAIAPDCLLLRAWRVWGSRKGGLGLIFWQNALFNLLFWSARL